MLSDVDPGKTLSVGVAGASYQGYSAGAIGISARINPEHQAAGRGWRFCGRDDRRGASPTSGEPAWF
ncbi:YadA-like family protein [Cupriavidus sp. SW-Y-13]|uniref:YadA-like family protein n=1 Tax=Cupriavidus sp. SW-Y-13 TaxID=2653854 RepID=UPI0013662771|nr:hypothetical protein [Cupriavidus sp. SW-Y-13]